MSSAELCRVCKQTFPLLQIAADEEYNHCVCIDITLLLPNNNIRKDIRKSQKRLKLEEILKKVSALRNSSGGCLFVHMKGISNYNRSMGLFNEYIDDHLRDLIEDGSPFDTEYYKSWCDDPSIRSSCEYIVLMVTGSSSVSTSDFKTKVAHDQSVYRPTSHNMDRHLCETKTETRPTLRGLEVQEESRSVQFKSIQPDVFSPMMLPQLITYIWDDLRLQEYISSFSKLQKGGSFYIGILEIGHLGQFGINLQGIPLPSRYHNSLSSGIYEKLKKDMLCFLYDKRSFRSLNEKDVKIEFYPRGSENFIVEIAVAPISGCVFYDIQGPEAYVMKGNGCMDRMTFQEWLDAFEKRKLCTRCQKSLCERCRPVFHNCP